MVRLEQITRIIGSTVLCLFIASILLVAVLRFGFETGHQWLFDFQKYNFAVLLPIAVLLAYLNNSHVRAGIAEHEKGRIFLLFEQALLVLVPCVLVLLSVLPVLLFSWSRLESSGAAEGMPGYYLAKSMLGVCLVILVFVALYRSLKLHKTDQ